MRIFAGPVEGRSLVAAPWHVDASLAEGSMVPDAFIWAALDCPSAFAMLPVQPGMTIVLGELGARIEGHLRPGDRCVAVGWPIHIEGRKRIAGSAVFRDSGEVVAVGRATWIEVPERAFAEETVRVQHT
jgi:acyl-coenzyme A thioesterase PaaI-like protein